jgi:hypothetical protein
MFSQVAYGNCKTTCCIIEVGCCPFLKGLEGIKKSLMSILFIKFCIIGLLFVFSLYYNSPKELRKAI